MKINLSRKLFFLVFFLLLGGAAGTAYADVYEAHTRVRLVAEQASVPREGRVWLGVHMTMDKGWHVYWRNPGDSGMAPSFSWTLPSGLDAGDIRWPYPQRIPAGPLTSFGYEEQVLLVVPVTVSENGSVPDIVDIKLKVSWLACRVDCVPGQAELSLSLPTVSFGEEPRPSTEAPLFEEARARWPVEMTGLQAQVEVSGPAWAWTIHPPFPREGKVLFFPFRDDLVNNSAEQKISRAGEALRLVVERSHLNRDVPQHLEGVLVHENGWDKEATVKAVTVRAPVVVAKAGRLTVPLTWWLACLFAFLGGVILNVMPCVLPVLSIKVLQLVQRETDRSRALAHAGFFVLGIMASFWILALGLLTLKAAGHAVGWGFQFQSPVFVFVIAVMLFIFALNLFGIFEISPSISGPKNANQGLGGAFISGVFMTVVATPCTAPFMGSALGFALAQPWPVGILVFTFLGLGLAAPMVLLTAWPRLTRFVPKPGPWMMGLKHVLGFILLGCVLWLVSVLGAQSGLEAVVRLLGVLLLSAFALWLVGRGRNRIGLAILVVTVLYGSLGMGAGSSEGGIVWRAYDQAAIVQARAQGRPVFIDFTAAWCLTCKVNDLTVLRSAAVVEAFKSRKVEAFMADWTSQDTRITEALSSFGRNSVPLYVYYAPGNSEAELLPELLTPALVLDVLEQ